MVKEKQSKGKAKRSASRSKKVSWICKPEGLSLEEWQIVLRQQVALEENFAISCIDEVHNPGEYYVKSPKTQYTYKVVYRGKNSRWNYCSCPDFKTSHLGTCKHLEAVKDWISRSAKRRLHREVPAYSSVYLSYVGARQVCIRIGSDHKEAYERLAEQYFDEKGVLRPDAYGHIEEFITQALTISTTFRFYQDALDFIAEHRDAKKRRALITKYNDEALDHLLKVPLHPYQREGVRFAFEKGKSIIADEMGLGKTIQAIATAELMRKEKMISSVLIVCPTSLKYQWKRELERFTDQPVHVIEGLHLQRKEQYALDVPYKIISYNSACNDIKVLGSLSTDLLIMDEVQRLKNWKTQISMAMRRVDSQYAVVLSGTPLENKLEELYTIMEFVDKFCLGPFWKFKDDCIVCDELGQVIGYKHLNKVGETIRQRLIRRTKKQVELQMPKRQDKVLFVPMTKEQQAEHDELKYVIAQLIAKWKRLHFLSEKDRNRLLLSLSKMRMLCDSTYVLDQQTRYDTKVGEVMNIINSLMESEGEKVVVFSQWERMTRLIAQELDKQAIGYEYLHGGVPSQKRGELITNFCENPDSRVLLSTDAGATGLNLQSASTLINVDLPWNPALLEQRIARIYRLGQECNVQIINLVAANTIEEQMLDKLRFKSAMFEGVLDNGEDSIFLDDSFKFEGLMTSLEDVVNAMPSAETTYEETTNGATSEVDDAVHHEEPQREGTDDEVFHHLQLKGGEDEHADLPSTIDESKTSTPPAPQDLIAQGANFFSGLVETLKSPEATEKLVDSLVETDSETGQTHIKIPVADKQTVKNVFELLGKLLGGSIL